MNPVRELLENGSDPIWWKRFVRRRLAGQGYFAIKPNNGTYVMEEDWDLMIILDGCRYDLYEGTLRETDRKLLPDLDYRVSRGTSTRQFIDENFADSTFMDTVYVTANPWIDLQVADRFHHVVPIWETEWDEAEQTVLPEAVHEHAIETAERYPRKRVIVHFMQPHYPFIGSSLTEKSVSWKLETDGESGQTAEEAVSVWNLLERGELDRADVWAAYKQNLHEVLPYARDLAESVTGKAVISSDHGNGAGEFCWPLPVRAYGHPRNIRIESLVKVPWHVFESSARREVHADPPAETRGEAIDDELVTERLEHLGYRS